jgi:hypothetical protein
LRGAGGPFDTPLATVAMAALAFVVFDARSAGAACAGRYVVTRANGSLVAGPGDVVVLDAAGAVVDPACGVATAHVRAVRGGSRVVARWLGCHGRRVLRLRVRASADCTLLRGTMSAGARRSRLVAVTSRCGDGVVDPGTGERCDDGAANGGASCDTSCGRCVDPSTLTSTWAAIQANVFDRSCIVCHGDKLTAGLDLRRPDSYSHIVGVPAASGRFEVKPGARTESLLWLKLAKASYGSDDESLAGGMPFGFALSPDVVEAVGRWIDAGAPPGGIVDGTAPLFVGCGG